MKPSRPKRGHARRDGSQLSPGDYKRQRRERRRGRTGNAEKEIRAWAQRHGFTLRVLNDGHHWLFQRSGFVAEWWPGSAKLAINRDYQRSHHAPNWNDVLPFLQKDADASPMLPFDEPF